jgi:hypothetical protein
MNSFESIKENEKLVLRLLEKFWEKIVFEHQIF